MTLQLAIPVSEILALAVCFGLTVGGKTVWEIVIPQDGSIAPLSASIRVEGTRMYDRHGRHFADWIPANEEQPGHWRGRPLDEHGHPIPAD